MYKTPIRGRTIKKTPEIPEVPNLMGSVSSVVKLVTELNRVKKSVDDKFEEIDSVVSDLRDTVEEVKSITKGEPGDSPDIGELTTRVLQRIRMPQDGKSVDETTIVNRLKMYIPSSVDEEALEQRILSKLPKQKSQLKIIQEQVEIDPMSVIDKILALPEEKRSKLLKAENISGLQQTVNAFHNQIGARGYLHGGGISNITGLITAGTNITITGNGTYTSPYIVNSSGGGGGSVISVSGTTNRITSTGGTTPVIDISSSYVGQSSITTLGTITSGVWNGTAIAIANGGTGQTTATNALTALLPSQAGHTGQILTTDGTSALWAGFTSSQWTNIIGGIEYTGGKVLVHPSGTDGIYLNAVGDVVGVYAADANQKLVEFDSAANAYNYADGILTFNNTDGAILFSQGAFDVGTISVRRTIAANTDTRIVVLGDIDVITNGTSLWVQPTAQLFKMQTVNGRLFVGDATDFSVSLGDIDGFVTGVQLVIQGTAGTMSLQSKGVTFDFAPTGGDAYSFPTINDTGVLVNDGAGNLSWATATSQWTNIVTPFAGISYTDGIVMVDMAGTSGHHEFYVGDVTGAENYFVGAYDSFGGEIGFQYVSSNNGDSGSITNFITYQSFYQGIGIGGGEPPSPAVFIANDGNFIIGNTTVNNGNRLEVNGGVSQFNGVVSITVNPLIDGIYSFESSGEIGWFNTNGDQKIATMILADDSYFYGNGTIKVVGINTLLPEIQADSGETWKVLIDDTGTLSSAPDTVGTVTSVSGTMNRITVASGTTIPVIDISSSYVGQSSITTLGTITSGVWNGTAIANANLANSAVTVNGTSISLGASGTVTAAAGTLTGTTLNATVVTSSLTTVGTIGTGTWNATTISLGKGGTGSALSDPGANKILAWDDTDNTVGFWTVGSGLSYDHATHTLSSTGGGGIAIGDPISGSSLYNVLFVDNSNNLGENDDFVFDADDGWAFVGGVNNTGMQFGINTGPSFFTTGTVFQTHKADDYRIVHSSAAGFTIGHSWVFNGTEVAEWEIDDSVKQFEFATLSGSGYTFQWRVEGGIVANMNTAGMLAKSYTPLTNDGGALGSTSLQFSDLFLAEGAVINWDNGDATITQTGNDITIAGITTFGVGTSTAVTLGTIELGAASDTTLSRSSAGVLAVEGVVIPSISSTNTLTNKRITKRTGTTASSATPTINTDTVDFYSITALAANITSFTSNLSGTPTEAQTLWIAITDDGTPRTIAWGTSFESSTVALPTTTVASTRMDVGFVWNTITSKWRCIANS